MRKQGHFFNRTLQLTIILMLTNLLNSFQNLHWKDFFLIYKRF